MTRLIAIAAVLMSCLSLQALTVKELIKKCRNHPDVHCQVIKKKDFLKDATEEDKEMLRSIKKVQCIVTYGSEKANLSADLNALSGYTLALSFNAGDDADVKGYGSDASSDTYLVNPVFSISMDEVLAILCVDGKLALGDAGKIVSVSTTSSISVVPSDGKGH